MPVEEGSVAAAVEVLTFLVSDIEGSTTRWEQDYARMAGLLAEHDVLVRGIIESHGGSIVKHTGDGFLTAFTSPGAAVDAAVACQVALQALGPDRLRVRMGLHTGEAEPRDGDYFGRTVNLAVRICSSAHGDQILVSEIVTHLAAGRPGGPTFHELGRVELKGLSEPERVFQVMADGLPAEFPPLRGRRAVDLLPVPATRLIGRDRELSRLLAALDASRLVTLVGPSGVGKSRLALAAAEHVAAESGEEVRWVELAPLMTGGDPALAIDEVLGAARSEGGDAADAAVAAIGERTMLLVLDNVEHVIEATAALVQRVVARCPGARLLLTSQVPLGLPGEAVLPLAPLPAERADDAAVELFLERAKESGAPLGPQSLDVVVELCRQLDGLPLAVELAASRARSLPPGEILRRLDGRLRLLRVERSAAGDRHQSLEAALRWSYDLLSDDERLLFDELSVFTGSFELDAAHAVAGSADDLDTLNGLSRLVDRSLVVAPPAGERPRYRLLTSTRDFAAARLAERPDHDHVVDRWAGWTCARARQLGAAVTGPDEVAAVRALHAEFDNLRSLSHHLVATGDADAATALVANLFWYAHYRDRWEVLDWALAALSVAGADDAPDAAAAHAVAGYFLVLSGRVDDGLAHGRRARELDPALPIGAELVATTAATTGDIPGAVAGYLEAAELARAAGQHYAATKNSVNLALLSFALEDPRVVEMADVIAADAERAGAPTALGCASLGQALALVGRDPVAAAEPLQQTMRLARATDASLLARTATAIDAVRAGRVAGDPAASVREAAQRALAWRRQPQYAWTPIRETIWCLHLEGRHEVVALLLGADEVAQSRWPTPARDAERMAEAGAVARSALGDDRYDERAAQGAAMDDDERFDLLERLADDADA